MCSKSGSIDVAKSFVLFADSRHAANSASSGDNVDYDSSDNFHSTDDDNNRSHYDDDIDPGKLQFRYQDCWSFGDCPGSVYDDDCKQLLLGTIAWI